MLSISALLVACAPTVTTGPARAPALDFASPEAHSTAASIDGFAADLHAALPKTGNLFYSPTSVALALGMAEQGAAGRTRAEMDKVLHLSGPLPYASLASPHASSKSPEIGIADRLYFAKTLSIEPAFAKLAPSETVDFQNDAEGVRKNIDAWVSDRTHARIPELIAPNVLDGDTRFVIVNAVYFKGQWETPFEREATRDAVFHGDADVNVPTMHATLSAGYGAHDGAHVLDLPYKHDGGPALSMTIVLPDARDGLSAVETAYEKEGIAPFVASLAPTNEIDVSLPKLKMSSSIELKDVLSAMGMPTAFGHDADFTGITRSEPLKIARVIHQAFGLVDEEGTEAAGATAVVGMANAVMLTTPFRVDHPFLFFIRDRASGVVLVAGRCVNPA